MREAHERFGWMQQQLHNGQKSPSEEVIDLHREKFGGEYRIETEGPHRWHCCAPARKPAVPGPTTSTRSNGRRATTGPADDVVDLLLVQHARIEELLLLVSDSTGEARQQAFDDLVHLLAVDETAEEGLIHPLVRTLPGVGGDALVDDRLAEERQAKETLTVLIDGGVDAEGFDIAVVRSRLRLVRPASGVPAITDQNTGGDGGDPGLTDR